jgi:PKHD-type hydroxylase|tara:strand:+ start:10580 stop:11203 length:624 start_codon:yes stop_codon:yes gene_type:complete
MSKTYVFDQPQNDPQQWYWFKEGLSELEVDKVITMASALPQQRATTIGDDGDETEATTARSSMVKWIPQTKEWEWLYEKLIGMAHEANDNTWGFDLVAAPENIQYTEYYASEEGHYDWHQDIGAGELPSRRKVSITLQLSSDNEYVGGELQLTGGGDGEGNIIESTTLPRGKGVGVLFPSYMMHRVSKVSKGVRRSLVLWVGGAHYR